MRRWMGIMVVGLLCLILMTGVGMAKPGGQPAWLPGYTSGNGVVPVNVSGNPTCTDLFGDSCTQFKIEDGQYNGIYYINSSNAWWITVESFKAPGCDDKCAINWTSNFDVISVIVKGGDAADDYSYSYNGNVRSDTLLSTPINANTGQPSAISHIIFCYDSTKLPPVEKPVPEFPAYFVPVAGILGLAGCVLIAMKK